MGDAHHLVRYARSREKAYRAMGRFTTQRAKAVSNILRVADYYRDKPLGPWVRQIIGDINQLLPGKYGRYSKQREQILTIIKNYEQLPKTVNADRPRVDDTY